MGAVARSGEEARSARPRTVFRNWRNFADYAGGIVADQGAHVFDGIHLLMNASYPTAVTAASRTSRTRKASTRRNLLSLPPSIPKILSRVFSMNYAAMKYKSRNDQMNHLDGDKARMDIGREDLKVYHAGRGRQARDQKTSAKGFGCATDLHVENFLECVRTRKTPTAPMRLGFQAALVVQMANISLKTRPPCALE